MTKLKIICLASLILLAIAPIKIQNVSAQEIPAEFPGRIESAGTYFEIKNSEYLNVTLESAEEIKVVLESIPKMISVDIESLADSAFTNLTISGLEPSKTYYKYQDSYKNGTVFISDENGIYNWIQEINQRHHVWIQETKGTTFIGEDTVLSHDIIGSVEIEVDNIILDCAGHSITGSGTGYGIKTYDKDKDNITIKNCTINNFSYGIYFYHSDGSKIINNKINDNYKGMLLTGNVNNSVIENNIISHSYIGILLAYASNDNKIRNNTVSFGDFNGIRLWECEDNLVTENDILNNGDGLVLAYSTDNKIYHNNFIDNDQQVYPYSNPNNNFDNGYPDGGNYWSNYFGIDEKSGPNQGQPGSDGVIDAFYTFAGGQDRYPFMKENGWKEPTNQLPIISNPGQFKSDKITSIIEGAITTESVVVFKATLNDPNNNQVKFQIELWEADKPFTEDNGEILNSDFVASGNEATITRCGLINGEYHWRARAVNSQEDASGWQEFGEAENVDFEVKVVPLYTQVISPYPSEDETDSWDHLPYAEGAVGNYDCGSTVADCGCAVTSMVMLGRFYDIDVDINDNNVDPKNINDWLNNNYGYIGGSVYWNKAIEYLGYIDEETDKKMVKLKLDYYNEPSTSSRIDDYIDDIKPIVAYSRTYGHYFVIDGKLKINNVDTYIVKDPYWYNTKTLNDSKNIANHIQDYNSHFTKANLFSYLETPKKIAASMYIYLASPAELVVTDSEGRKLGRNPIDDTIYNEIPDSSYTMEGAIISSDDPLDEIYEKKVIYIPNPIDGSYDIQVIGTGAGDYTLTSLIYNDEGESKEIIQKGSIIQNNIHEFELDYSTQSVQQTKTYQFVDIDIKPRGRLNIIRIKSIGVTRVAVLSDQFFDAREVVADSVLFAGASPLTIKRMSPRWRFRDVDKDGDLDLILYFRTRSLNLNPTDTEAVLTGELNDGDFIEGSDSVKVINRHNKNKWKSILRKL